MRALLSSLVVGALVAASSSSLAAPAPAWDAPPFTAPAAELLKEAAALPPLDARIYSKPLSETLAPLPGKAEAAPSTPHPAPVDLIADDVDLAFDAEGVTRTEHRIIYLRTRDAASSWAMLEVDWEPWCGDRPVVRARVISPDGVEHAFDPSTASDVAAADDDDETIGDQRALRCVLPSVTAGSVIEQTVVTRSRGLVAGVLPAGFEALPWTGARRFRLTVTGAQGMKLAHRETGALSAVKSSTRGGVETLSLDLMSPPPSQEVEGDEPRDALYGDWLLVAPAQSWQHVARSYAKVVDAQIASGDVADRAKTWAGDATKPFDVVSRLLAALQKNVRYTGLELGSAAVVPRPPKQTVERGFGDCKDLATTLVALLRARGLRANVVLLRPVGADPNPAVPRLEAFSHAIVHVEAPDLWLDPTQSDLRAGEALGPEEGALVLVASPRTTSLVRVPESRPEDSRVETTRTLTLAEDGPARLTETQLSYGYAAAAERDAARGDVNALRERYEGWVKRTQFAKGLARFAPPDPDADGPAKLEFDVVDTRRGWTKETGATAYVDPSALFTDVPDALEHPPVGTTPRENHQPMQAVREHDLLLSIPVVSSLRYRVVPPPGYVVKSLPPPLGEGLPFVASRQVSVDDAGVVTVDYRLELKKRRLTPGDVERIRAALDPLREEIAAVEFDSVAAKRFAAGDVRGAVAEDERLVALHPKEALHLTRLARLLESARLGRAARARAKAAAALEPKSGEAQRTLGFVLERDLLGRPYRGNFDRAGAIAAYRAAIALDDKDFVAGASLAELLMRGADGDRFSAGADVQAALGELRRLAALGAPETSELLAMLLLQTGRNDELLALAPKQPQSAVLLGLEVAAVAARDGVDAATTRAGQLATDDAPATALLFGAGIRELPMRRYDLWTALWNAAIARAPANTYPRELTRLVEAAQPPAPGSPAAAFLRLLRLFSKSVPPSGEWRPLFADERHGDLGSAPRQLGGFQPADMKGLAIPPAAQLDIALRMMSAVVDGDESTGWRVRLSFDGQLDRNAFFFVREHGRVVLLAGSDEPSYLAGHIASLIASHQEAVAAKWLDWALATPAGHIVQAFWTAGEKDEAKVRRASLVLGAYVGDASGLAPRLLAEAAQATGMPAARLRMAAGAAYARDHQFTPALAIADTLEADLPDGARMVRAGVLGDEKHWPELMALLTPRLTANPSDFDTAARVEVALRHQAKYEELEKTLRPSATQTSAPEWLLNDLAWNALFLSTSRLQDAEADARRAILGERKASALHTLASIEAEEGEGAAAMSSLVESVDQASGRLVGEDWYVVGRVEELYGLDDDAREAYRQVPGVDAPEPGTTGLLAARRLQQLGKR